MNFIKLFYALLTGFFLSGCGSQKSLQTFPEIKSTYEINSTKSIQTLQRQYGEDFVDSYLAEDGKTLFLQVKTKLTDYKYSLLQYDISKSTPELIKKVVDLNPGFISGIEFLPEHKLIYLRSNYKGQAYFIRIYDYYLHKEIRKYVVRNDEALNVSPDKLSFTKGDIKHDISDIYVDISSWLGIEQEKIKSENKKYETLYRDDIDGVVVDPINQLVWQDDLITVQIKDDIVGSTQFAAIFSVISKAAGKYNWRIPSVEEVQTLFSTYNIDIISEKFQYIEDGWSITNKNLDTYQDDNKYDFVWTGFNMINLTFADIKGYNQPHFLRLVSDFEGVVLH